MLRLLICTLFVIICDCAPKESSRIEVIKDDVETIVSSINTFAFDILEDILEYPPEENAPNSVETTAITPNNRTSKEVEGNSTENARNSTDIIDNSDTTVKSNVIIKGHRRKRRSVSSSDDLLQLCKKHYADQCASKSPEEQALERKTIDDLKEEVKKLLDIVNLLQDQNTILATLRTKKFQYKTTTSDSPKPNVEELALINEDVKTAIVELNDTRKMLDSERAKNHLLQGETKKQKAEIVKLKAAIEEIVSLNFTGPGDNGNNHVQARSSDDLAQIEKMLSGDNDSSEIEAKIQQLQKKVTKRKLERRLRKLEEALKMGDNAENDQLLINLRKVFKKADAQNRNDDIDITNLEDLQQAIDKLQPKQDDTQQFNEAMRKLLAGQITTAKPTTKEENSAPNPKLYPYICMVDDNAGRYDHYGMRNLQFYGPPPEHLINHYAIKQPIDYRPVLNDYYSSVPYMDRIVYDNRHGGNSYSPLYAPFIPVKSTAQSEFSSFSNSEATIESNKAPAPYGTNMKNYQIPPSVIKGPQALAAEYSAASSGEAQRLIKPPQPIPLSSDRYYSDSVVMNPNGKTGIKYGPSLDIRTLSGAKAPTSSSSSDQLPYIQPNPPKKSPIPPESSDNFQTILYNSPPSSSQLRSQFFPLPAAPPQPRMSQSEPNNQRNYYHAANSDDPRLRKSHFDPQAIIGVRRYAQDMNREVDGIQKLLRSLRKPDFALTEEESRNLAALDRQIAELRRLIDNMNQKNRTRRSTEDNKVDDNGVHQMIDLVGNMIKDTDQNRDSNGLFNDIQNHIDLIKNHLDPNTERASGQAPIYPYLPQLYQPFKNDLKKPPKDDFFTDLIGKLLDKLIAAIPTVLQKLFNISLEQLSSYDYQETDIANLFKKLGVFGYLPVVILRLISGFTSFVNILRRNRFFKNYLVPSLVLVTVGGSVLFLTWWLQYDDSYDQNHYQPVIGYGGASPAEYAGDGGVSAQSTPNIPAYGKSYFNQ